MEFEEIVKRVEWLDDQQRKGRADFHEINGRLSSLGGEISTLTKQLKALGQQVKDISIAAARMEQFDQIMAKHRADLAKMIETVDRNAVRREQEATQLRRAELEEMRKAIFQVSTSVSAEETARKERGREEQRRTVALQDLRASVDTAVRETKDLLEAQKTLAESQRQEAKRLGDLQGELAAVRKRADDAREKTTLHADIIRNMESRVGDLVQTESARQEQHTTLVQQQALAQVPGRNGRKGMRRSSSRPPAPTAKLPRLMTPYVPLNARRRHTMD
jgi:chromosome segregation ATPase